MTEPLDDARGELLARAEADELIEVGAADAFEEAEFAILYRVVEDSGSTTKQEIFNVPESHCAYIAKLLRTAPARCDAESVALGPCTQAELDAFEGLNDKSKQLLLMWMDRALKAEAALVPPPSEAGREEQHPITIEQIARTMQENMSDKSGCFVSWQTCYAAAEAIYALSADPGTVAVASAQYRCTCGAEPYCAPNVHAASCPLAVTSQHHGSSGNV